MRYLEQAHAVGAVAIANLLKRFGCSKGGGTEAGPAIGVLRRSFERPPGPVGQSEQQAHEAKLVEADDEEMTWVRFFRLHAFSISTWFAAQSPF